MKLVTEGVLPHVWTGKEAQRSGHTAYRINIPITGNPFTGPLGEVWHESYQLAESSDDVTPKFKHRDYYERPGRDRDDPKEKPRHRRNSGRRDEPR